MDLLRRLLPALLLASLNLTALPLRAQEAPAEPPDVAPVIEAEVVPEEPPAPPEVAPVIEAEVVPEEPPAPPEVAPVIEAEVVPEEPPVPPDGSQGPDGAQPDPLASEEVPPALSDAELRSLLLQLFGELLPEARAETLMRIASSGQARVLPVLYAWAEGGDLEARRAALAALGTLPDPGVAYYLTAIATNEGNPVSVRLGAIEALANHGTDLAGELLFDLARVLTGDPGVRAERLVRERFPVTVALRTAIESGRTDLLAESPRDAELVALLVHLSDPTLPEAQLHAVRGLAALGDVRAVPALQGAVQQGDLDLAEAALRSLGSMDHPLASHALGRVARNARLSTIVRSQALAELLGHRNDATPDLIFELSWELEPLFQREPVASRSAAYAKEVLAARTKERVVVGGDGYDVEMLIDLHQRASSRRRSLALARMRQVTEREDLLLAAVAQLRQPALKEEAVATVGAFDSDRARVTLGRLVTDVYESMRLRHLALETLARQHRPAAGRLLLQLHRAERDDRVKEALFAALKEHYPDAARQAGLVVDEIDRGGLVPMMIGGALHGGAMMGMASDAINPGETDLIVLPLLGGAILGAGGPLLLTLGDEVTPPEAFWVSSMGAWGLVDGALTAALFYQDDASGDRELRWLEAAMVAGQITGLVTSWVSRKEIAQDGGQVGYVNLAGFLGTSAGIGLALLDEDGSINLAGGLGLTGSVGGLMAAHYLAKDVKFSNQDGLVMASSTWIGAWTTGWLSHALGVDHDAGAWGGAMLGAGLGFAGGSVLGAFTEVETELALYGNAAFIAGNVAGFGAANLVEDPSSEALGALMVGGGAAALAGVALFGRDFRFEGADRWTALSSSWMSGWTGAWLAETLGADHEMGSVGGACLGSALGFGVGSVLAAHTDADPGFLGFANLAFAAGNLGGLGAALQWDDADGRLAGAWLVGGGSLALGAALTFGQELEFSTTDVQQSFFSAGLGGWTGYWALRAAREDHGTAAGGGLLMGASLGFGAASIIAAHTEPERDHLFRGLAGFGVGTAFGAGLGLVIPDLDDPWVEALMLAGGWASGAGYMLAEERTRYSSGDLALLSLGGGWGAWQGISLWRATDPKNERIGTGAVLLGSATGLLATTAVSQYVDWEPSRIGWATSGGIAGTVIGSGIGKMIPELESEGLWTLGMAGGWAGLLTEILLVPPADFTGGDVFAMLAGTGWGMGQSWLIARAVGAEGDKMTGALMLGGGMGYLSGEAFGRVTDLAFREVLFTELASYGASGFGAGCVLLGGGNDKALAAVTSLAGWGGKIGTGFVADRMRFAPDDAWEYLMGQAFGTWQGLGYAAYFDAGERRTGGATLVGMSAGYLAPMIFNQLNDFSAYEDLLLMGGIVWGTWFGVWSPYSWGSTDWGSEGDPKLLGALIGGEVGLVATGLSLALGAPPDTVGWTQLVGLMGMALGSTMTAMFTQEGPSVGTGMLIGTAGGLVAGAIWGGVRHKARQLEGAEALDEGTEAAGAELTFGTPRAHGGTGLAGLRLPRWLETLRPASLVAPPPVGHDDQPVLLLGVEGVL